MTTVLFRFNRLLYSDKKKCTLSVVVVHCHRAACYFSMMLIAERKMSRLPWGINNIAGLAIMISIDLWCHNNKLIVCIMAP